MLINFLLLVIFTLWVLGGIAAYVMMWHCDTATNAKLCYGKFYVLDAPKISFFLLIILGPISILIGCSSLCFWRRYTENLRRQLQPDIDS